MTANRPHKTGESTGQQFQGTPKSIDELKHEKLAAAYRDYSHESAEQVQHTGSAGYGDRCNGVNCPACKLASEPDNTAGSGGLVKLCADELDALLAQKANTSAAGEAKEPKP